MFNGPTYSKQLLNVASGKAAQDLTDEVTRFRGGNIHYAGRPGSRPSVTSVSGGTATVSDCFGSTKWIPVYSSGPNKDKSAVGDVSTAVPYPITATLKQFDGSWLVTDAVTGDKPC